MAERKRIYGTTLVELLVVIVIFLVGILAVVQIFPGGFKVLSNTRNIAVAQALARDEIERIKSRPDQLPEQILPVRYVFNGSSFAILADPNRSPGDLGPVGVELTENGDLIDAGGDSLGPWPYFVSSNVMRRVIGEGQVIPSPSNVGVTGVGEFGSLMSLQFAPVVFNPLFESLFQVYGNDMDLRLGVPFRVRDWIYYLDSWDSSEAVLYFPRSTTQFRSYRVSLVVYVNLGGTITSREFTDLVVDVPPDLSGGHLAVLVSDLTTLGGGESLVAVDGDSIRVARRFEPLALTDTFDPTNPYQYKVLNSQLGQVLLNPAGYNYRERRGNRTLPLVARASYDVYDWRILRQEFRVTRSVPPTQKLSVAPLMVSGNAGPDGRTFEGMNIILDPAIGTVNPDFILLDMETGGIYLYNTDAQVNPLLSAYRLDKSNGILMFNDLDNDPSNGIQARLAIQTASGVVIQVVDVADRPVRALYMARDQWSVQATKAATNYTASYGLPGSAQYYVGTSAAAAGLPPLSGSESPTRIYFPRMDGGQKVVIGEVWYRDDNNNVYQLRDQDFAVQTSPTDPVFGLPYVDITSVAPDALAFDFSRGYAVRRVRGAALQVRVLWNPNYFTLGADPQQNIQRLELWGQGWRRSSTETYLQKGDMR
ncbi:MAG: hypothetical protein ACK4XJ_03680 [Fimbriimonadaceae bacterium]